MPHIDLFLHEVTAHLFCLAIEERRTRMIMRTRFTKSLGYYKQTQR